MMGQQHNPLRRHRFVSRPRNALAIPFWTASAFCPREQISPIVRGGVSIDDTENGTPIAKEGDGHGSPTEALLKCGCPVIRIDEPKVPSGIGGTPNEPKFLAAVAIRGETGTQDPQDLLFSAVVGQMT
jgi:hypothetical protein